jgi:glycosyltransferase involved in cell wall biosynthesis
VRGARKAGLLTKSVCILVQSHYESDIRVRRKAEALVSAGYSVDVLALRPSHSSSKNYTLNGVNVYTISLGKKRGALGRYLFEYLAFFAWAFCKLSFLHRNRAYAAVDVNNLPDFLVFAATWVKRMGVKVVFDMHEITPEFYTSKFGIQDKTRMVRLLERIEKASFDFADHVITINEPVQDLLVSRGLPVAKSTVIMNSADEALFGSKATEGVGAVSQNAPRVFVMMYHGTLTRIYGLDIAIQAFSRVHEQMPGAEFVVLGSGPERSSLEALCAKLGLGGKVRFLGSVLPQEVRHWLSHCDVGVLATRRDVFLDFSFSNKLSEYIIMGKPVIASRLKTVRHYFSEEALVFFEPNSAANLAKQMLSLFRNPQLRGQFAEKAKLEYAPINWTVMKRRYLELMAGITGTEAQAVSRSPSPARDLAPVETDRR